MNPEILKRIESECEQLFPILDKLPESVVVESNSINETTLKLYNNQAIKERKAFIKGAKAYAEKCENLAEALREIDEYVGENLKAWNANLIKDETLAWHLNNTLSKIQQTLTDYEG